MTWAGIWITVLAVRGRPSPSMAVALLSLSISLGGVSYGVATGTIGSREVKNNSLRSKDVRNRSLVGKDLRRNTVKGSEVRESSLGTVPRATKADSATTADRATSATTAGNASTLAGLGPGAFLRSTQIRTGSANQTATSQQTIVRLPELNATLVTDGDSDADKELAIHKSPGDSATVFLSTSDGGGGGSGDFSVTTSAPGPLVPLAVYKDAAPSRRFDGECTFSGDDVDCTLFAIGF